MLMLQNCRAILRGRQPLAPQIWAFYFNLVEPESLKFEAGQYFLLEIPGGFRQYSISSSPNDQKSLQIIVDTSPMGAGSKFLLGLKEGMAVKFRAPMGAFVLKNSAQPKMFLATGAGIAPIKSMIHKLLESGFNQPVSLYWGVRESTNLYLRDIWEHFAQTYSNFDYLYCLSREAHQAPHSYAGRIQEKLKTLDGKLSDTDFYLCGRTSTVEQLKEFLLTNLSIKPENIHHEKFT